MRWNKYVVILDIAPQIVIFSMVLLSMLIRFPFQGHILPTNSI